MVINRNNGDRIKMPGIARSRSRIRFDIGIGGNFPTRSIREFYQMLRDIKNHGISISIILYPPRCSAD
jgi:hypothetical protein